MSEPSSCPQQQQNCELEDDYVSLIPSSSYFPADPENILDVLRVAIVATFGLIRFKEPAI